MSQFSDEPVLVPPSARRDWKRWGAAALALVATGLVVYVPLDKARKEEAAHHALRGERQGVLLKFAIKDVPHSLELTWARGRFAPVLTPPPPPGAILRMKGRFGEEVLSWNPELGAFGPGATDIDPYAHYKVSLRLEIEGRNVWGDTVWAYGIHDTHDHAH
jgi:hypothetical protein